MSCLSGSVGRVTALNAGRGFESYNFFYEIETKALRFVVLFALEV